MDRSKIHELFKRHRGEMARLARELDVDDTTLSAWFVGRINSTKISQAVWPRAEELLLTEERSQAAFRQAYPRVTTFAGLQAAA